MICPLLRKVKKGTIITFQSSGEDLTTTFNNTSKKFKFSKFALLDIPPIKSMVNGENSLQFAAIEGAFTEGLSTASPFPEDDRVDLSESFQNYVMNIETLIINEDAYNRNSYLNTSERIFFKWLKEVGGIRFRYANSNEKASTVSGDLYVEEDPNQVPGNGDIYNRVVKYIGEVDIEGNNYSSNKNAFKEVYVYVPSQNGSTPTVLFKSIEDENYYLGKTIKKSDNVNIEYIQGQDPSGNPSAAGLRTKALYDMDVPSGYDYLVNNDPAQLIWFDPLKLNGPDAYFTDPTFANPSTDLITRTNPSTGGSITYKRSRLDGICMDFIKDEYRDFENDPELKCFSDYDNSNFSSSFKFNTILLYYDLCDPNDNSVLATNLFGVCFLEDVEIASTGASQLGQLEKVRQNNVLGQQGNGYGFKFNFKFDPTNNEVTVNVEVSVNDYNTFSMLLFADTMQRINLLTKNFEDVMNENVALAKKNEELMGLIINDQDKTEIKLMIEAMDAKVNNIYDNSAVLALLKKNEQMLQEILAGNTTVDVNFVLNLRPEDGLSMYVENGELYLKNNAQEYELVKQFTMETSQTQTSYRNILANTKHNSLYYHEGNGTEITLNENIYIYLDDTIEWRNFQEMTIYFKDPINFNGYGLVFYTDAANKLAAPAAYSKFVGAVDGVTIKNPVVKIVCLSKADMSFLVLSK